VHLVHANAGSDARCELTSIAHDVMIVGVNHPLGILAVAGTLGAALASTPAGAQPPPPLASFDTAWAAIARSYWDTTFIASTWKGAHDSLRTGLGVAPSDADVRRAIRALIAVPRQSHFVLIPASAVPEPGAARVATAGRTAVRGTAGLDLRSIDFRLVAWRVEGGHAAARAGVRPGDVITRIRGLDLDSARRALRGSTPGGAVEAERLLTRLALGSLMGDAGDRLPVMVQGTRGRPRRVTLELTPITARMTQFGNLPPMLVTASRDSLALGRGGWVAVVRFSSWFPALSADLDSILFASRGASGMIIDLRGNPGGIVGMVAGVSGHLLDTAVSLGTLRGRGSTIRFVANPRRVDGDGRPFPPFAGPVAILTDELTGSTSEFFAAGMQARKRARIFGDRSAGQSLPALMRRLPSGDVMLHAIADHEDPIGRRIEGVGVRPDVMVPFTRSDLRAGRDPVVDRALRWIAQQGR
jgi:carboxyl-terminal processing protease